MDYPMIAILHDLNTGRDTETIRMACLDGASVLLNHKREKLSQSCAPYFPSRSRKKKIKALSWLELKLNQETLSYEEMVSILSDFSSMLASVEKKTKGYLNLFLVGVQNLTGVVTKTNMQNGTR